MIRNKEQGVASILTVIFFILIISVITVGFMRMALSEGRETLQDSLSKSAMAAAYSGVNDAKRALIYCGENPTAPECGNLNNASCPGFFADPTLRGRLGLPGALDATGSVGVGDANANERYTCVKIVNDTSNVVGPLQLNQSNGTEVVQLRSVTPYTQIRISWHKKTPTGTVPAFDGIAPNFDILSNYRPYGSRGTVTNNWGQTWPAVLRTSLSYFPLGTGIVYNPDGTTNISEITKFLYPKLSAATTAPITNGITKEFTDCNQGATPGYTTNGTEYMCRTTLTGVPYASATTSAYLQLSTIYTSTDYAIELLDAAGNPVMFDNISPLIDSTGAVENVFRRVQVRVKYCGGQYGCLNPIQPNALDVGKSICKDFSVGDSGFADSTVAAAASINAGCRP